MTYVMTDLIRLAKTDHERRTGRVALHCQTPNWVRAALHSELRKFNALIGMTLPDDAEITHLHGMELWINDNLEFTDIVCVVTEQEPR